MKLFENLSLRNKLQLHKAQFIVSYLQFLFFVIIIYTLIMKIYFKTVFGLGYDSLKDAIILIAIVTVLKYLQLIFKKTFINSNISIMRELSLFILFTLVLIFFTFILGLYHEVYFVAFFSALIKESICCINPESSSEGNSGNKRKLSSDSENDEPSPKRNDRKNSPCYDGDVESSSSDEKSNNEKSRSPSNPLFEDNYAHIPKAESPVNPFSEGIPGLDFPFEFHESSPQSEQIRTIYRDAYRYMTPRQILFYQSFLNNAVSEERKQNAINDAYNGLNASLDKRIPIIRDKEPVDTESSFGTRCGYSQYQGTWNKVYREKYDWYKIIYPDRPEKFFDTYAARDADRCIDRQTEKELYK